MQFFEAEGWDHLLNYIESLRQQGKRYEVIVIRFMDAFSYISMLRRNSMRNRQHQIPVEGDHARI